MRAARSITLTALLPLLAACGPSAQQVAAEDTVRTASRALAEAHTTGGEDARLRVALDEADTWLAHGEEAVNEWGSGARSFAWETMAPCLARALRDVRDALLGAGHDVPTDLESAEVSASAVTDHRCPRREGSR
ncbi:MAG: hypothetical protein J0L92_05310 [Deltaproteobacteria bacterium]|nr:hypothetical protein [Deltaproteobacteria bacterium]